MPLGVLAYRAETRILRGPAWGAAVLTSALRDGRRSHGVVTLGKLVVALLAAAGGGATSAPTWRGLVEASGRDERTVARWVAWLRAQGLLVTVEHGSTVQFRPRTMDLEGNRAAVYLLTVPLLQRSAAVVQRDRPGRPPASPAVSGESVTPSTAPRRGSSRRPPHARTSVCADRRDPLVAAGRTKDSQGGGGGVVPKEPSADLGPRGQRRAKQLILAAALRERSLDLRGISAAAVAAVVRPFLTAGWGVEDLVHAIDHEPGGAARRFTAGPGVQPWAGIDVDRPEPGRRRERQSAPVGSPGAWLAWRLRPWSGHQPPTAARRVAAVTAQAAAAAAAAARRAENAAAALAATPPPTGFAAARAALRESAGQRRSGVRQPWTPAL